ncbi:MAG TPA: cell division protein FtsL [Candidatus Angelobacter sp.]
MAAGAMNITGMITPVGPRTGARRCVAGITPEFYFHKTIDNSRVVKVSDPQRRREIRMLSASVAALFLVVMFYTWQHFRAVEYGYRIEAQRSERDRLADLNRALKLEEASLRDPGRIDLLAQQMGLKAPDPGQVVRLDTEDSAGRVIAQISPVAVISAQ